MIHRQLLISYCALIDIMHHATLLWLVLISLVLAPLSTLHVHAADDLHQSTVLHGGHVHDFDTDEADDGSVDLAEIVDAQLVASDRGIGDLRWTEWLPSMSAPSAACSSWRNLTSNLSLPSVADRVIARRNYWKPPLRGPPLIFNNAR
ncbi:MAG: hypothetical protein ACRER3_16435 [Pseudomonas fluorescens]